VLTETLASIPGQRDFVNVWGFQERGQRRLGACRRVHEAELKLSPTEDDPRHTIGRVAIYRDLVRLAPHKALPDLYH
jgi:hypothetical protein